MKKALIFLMLLLALDIVNSASLEGNVYDISLDKIKNVIVEIDTKPLQRIVAKGGTYEFKSIPVGSYSIRAYTPDKKLESIDNITIESDGSYNYDIFLIPELEETNQKISIWPYIIGLVILIIIVLMFLRYGKKPVKEELDKDLNYLIDIIKKEGNRATQKDLVQKTGLSEAKISLMITDLESKGAIKKIRKGRANIIILNK